MIALSRCELQLKNYKIEEVTIPYQDRDADNPSKLNTVFDGFKVVRTIGRLFKEYKPSIFFTILSLFFLLISAIFAIPVFVEYFQTGLVPRFPTFIFSGFLLMISLLSLMCGIILEVVVKKHRQLFELILIRTKRDKE